MCIFDGRRRWRAGLPFGSLASLLVVATIGSPRSSAQEEAPKPAKTAELRKKAGDEPPRRVVEETARRDARTAAEEAADRLRREMTRWKTLEAKVRYDRTVSPMTPGNTLPPIASIEEHLIETRSGQRYLGNRTFAGKLGGLRDAYCDGSRCATVMYSDPVAEGVPPRPRQVVIGETFLREAENKWNARPYPFRAYYVGLEPLYKALPRARRIGEERVAGRECDLYAIEGYRSGWGVHDLVFALDRQTAVPLKETVYTAPDRLASKRPVWIWEADSFDTVQGYHLAKKSHYRQFAYKDGKPVSRLVESLRVEEVGFDKTFDRDVFWPEPLTGVEMIDSTKSEVRPFVVLPGKPMWHERWPRA